MCRIVCRVVQWHPSGTTVTVTCSRVRTNAPVVLASLLDGTHLPSRAVIGTMTEIGIVVGIVTVMGIGIAIGIGIGIGTDIVIERLIDTEPTTATRVLGLDLSLLLLLLRCQTASRATITAVVRCPRRTWASRRMSRCRRVTCHPLALRTPCTAATTLQVLRVDRHSTATSSRTADRTARHLPTRPEVAAWTAAATTGRDTLRR